MDAKTDGRAGVKAANPKGGKAVRKVKRTIVLTPGASARLDVQALGMGLDVGVLVERMIDGFCGDYELVYRGAADSRGKG